MDKRDETTWVALELTRAGELKAIDGKLASWLRRELAVSEDFPIFVPYTSYKKGGRNVSIRLIEGYAFVATGLPETKYFQLESRALINSVLSSRGRNGIRILQALPNNRIVDLQTQLREILQADLEIGQWVRVAGGNYSGIEGEVVDVYEDTVAIRIRLRSLDVIAAIPKTLVDPNFSNETELEGEVEAFESYEDVRSALLERDQQS